MDVAALLSYPLPDREVAYCENDVILYALGVGCRETDLERVYEAGLKPYPFYGLVLGHPGFWLRDPVLKIDWVRILHADQAVTVYRDLPPAGTVTASFKVRAIVDKGADKGAIVYVDKTLSDADGAYCTLTQGIFCRGDGGCGNVGEEPPALLPVPDRAPDFSHDEVISERAAAIYRLSGDLNPLHIDPAVARDAGFDRPILHGMCTLGMAGKALIDHAAPFGGMACRFSSPVYPGETLTTDIWSEAGHFAFRARIAARDVTVLDRGRSTIREE